jgi:hypothetical protein
MMDPGRGGRAMTGELIDTARDAADLLERLGR